tara:strand:- start:517 stop:900 length:384 start_codon:yes stop_codon:yes gene_type:complete
MKKIIINTTNAPSPIGPYSQGVLMNRTLYISGQIAINPSNNKLIIENIEKEVIQVMSNIKAILNEANMSFENVVKTSIFLKNINDSLIVNKIYSGYFKENIEPARETIEVSKLPKNVNVEMSMIAVL